MSGPAPKPATNRQGHRKRPSLALVLPEKREIVTPDPPKGITKPARQCWESFWQSDVAAAIDIQADSHRLLRWITAVDEWHRVGKAFRKERVVSGSMGQPVINPLATYLTSLEATIKAAEAEFGMTPMARLKLGIAVGQAAKTAADLNRMVEQEGHDDSGGGEDDALEGEWEEA